MVIAGTQSCFIQIKPGSIQSAIFISIHDIVVELLYIYCISVVSFRISPYTIIERSETKCQSFLNKVIIKFQFTDLAYGNGNIQRTLPITVGKYLQQEQIHFSQHTYVF